MFALICLGLCYYIAGYPQGYVTEKNVQNGSVYLIMLSILPLVLVGTYLFFFTDVSPLYLYLKKAEKVLYETNKHVMDFRFS